MEINDVKKLNRYKNITILKKPIKFLELFKDKDIRIVQLHDMSDINGDICGFSGQFKWENNKIISLDGDTYTSDMLVYGYEITDQYTDILVKEW